MRIVCPNCGFERDVPTNAIPASATKVTCPKCNVKFTFREFVEEEKNNNSTYENQDNKPNITVDISKDAIEQNELSQERKTESSSQHDNVSNINDNLNSSNSENKQQEPKKLTPEEEELLQKAHQAYREQLEKIENLKKQGYVLQALAMVPWESNSKNKNILDKFFQTIVQVLLSAPAFFGTMFRPYPFKKAMYFYLIISFIQFAARYFTFMMSDSVNAIGLSPEVVEMISSPSFAILTAFIAPLIIALQFFAGSTLLYSVVKLVQPERADFNLIARIFAYASAPAILSVVPILGDFLSLPWSLYNIIVACRYGLHLTFGKTAIATLAFTLFSMVLLSIFSSVFAPML